MKAGVLVSIFNFFTRGILGMGIVYFANLFLESQGLLLGVGMNFWTFSTSGILGIPGVALLYGVQFFQIL